jgi:hypothetical protein
VTANAGTNLNTSLLALETGGNLATVAGAVTASKMNVNVSSGVGAVETGGNLATLAGAVASAKVNVNLSSGSIGNTAFGVNAGTAVIGFVRVLPSSCTQTTSFANATSQVATGAGTTVTSTTTCVTFAYANNITNSAVTLRIADKSGTPVIWLGGGTDFSVPANSNIRVPIDGVVFTSGITAIAGTATAINLQINGMQ